MLTSLLLLFPVSFILLWALLPALDAGRFQTVDYFVIALLFSCALYFIYWVFSQDWSELGPIWPHVLAVIGGYLILACGLVVSFLVRRSRSNL